MKANAKSIVYELLLLLRQKGLTLSVVESITGGLIMKTIVDYPTFGSQFLGGYVAYNDSFKHNVFDMFNTPYSVEGTAELACKCKIETGSDCVIAITGHAGPSSDIGHIYISIICGTIIINIDCNLRTRYENINLIATRYEEYKHVDGDIIDADSIALLSHLRKCIRYTAMYEAVRALIQYLKNTLDETKNTIHTHVKMTRIISRI